MKKLNSLPVLMIHHVSPSKGALNLSPQLFFKQMHALKKAGFHTLNTKEVEEFFQGKPLPLKSLLLTFDDGYLDNRVYAYPILKFFQMRAIVFLVSDWVKNERARPIAQIHFEKNKGLTVENAKDLPSTPDHFACEMKIKENKAHEVILNVEELLLMQDVFEYHPHTHSHARFDQLFEDNPIEKQKALEKDLIKAQDFFKTHLGETSTHLCWPQGYFDEDYVKTAQSLGFEFLYTTQPGENTHQPFSICRFPIKERGGWWIKTRLKIYSSPRLARLYTTLHG